MMLSESWLVIAQSLLSSVSPNLNTKNQTMKTHTIVALSKLGLSAKEIDALGKIERTLHRWAERKCGTDAGYIFCNEENGKPYWFNSKSPFNGQTDPRAISPIRDLEKGALKRLDEIMQRHPSLVFHHQTDPRGVALYIMAKSDLNGTDPSLGFTTHGIAVY